MYWHKKILSFDFKRAVEVVPLAERGIIRERERELESLFSFGNGYIGTRNSFEELYPDSTPGTFIAGLYTSKPDDEFNFLVRCPDWTSTRVYVAGNILNLREGKTLHHLRYIDFEKGTIVREWQNEDRQGRITNIKIIKYISLANKNEMGKFIVIKPVNYSGDIHVTTGIDCNTADFTYLLNMNSEIEGYASIKMMTKYDRNQGKHHCPAPCFAFVQKSTLTAFKDGLEKELVYGHIIKNLFSGSFEVFRWKAELETTYVIKNLCIASLDEEGESPIQIALSGFSRRSSADGKDIHTQSFEEHQDKWCQRFEESQVNIAGCDYDQKAMDFAIFHLITSGEFSGGDHSIPARNLSGEAYRGHVFWDTEMYLVPFFTYTKPEIARALLMYRYNTLVGARENAIRDGHKGASFAWESTDTGHEAAPYMVILPTGEVVYIYSGKYEIHISCDIVYAIQKYWQATGDDDFIADNGSEVIFETARFYKSLLFLGEDGLYHINSVIGPDEYHERVDDNAYTNYLVKNNFELAVKIYNWMSGSYHEKLSAVRDKIGLTEEEVDGWAEIKERIYSGYNPETMLFEQFKGYYDLEYVNLSDFEPRSAPMDIILGREKTAATQVIKQADVLMFLMLFGERFSKEQLIANFDYYEERCGHGSSLSPSVHCITAARAGKTQKAYGYFRKNAQIDLSDTFGNSSGGIHIAAQGGMWLSAVFGFSGMYAVDKGLIFDPSLPDEWDKLEYQLKWRGQRLNVVIYKDKMLFSLEGDKPIFISAGRTNNIDRDDIVDIWKEIFPGREYTAIKHNYPNGEWEWREDE